MEHWKRLKESQARRARAYVQWNGAFTSAIAAQSSPADFQAVAGVVMQELGAVSEEIRALQAEAGAPPALKDVVDRLQDCERRRYESTVEVQRLLAVHTNNGVVHDSECIALRSAPAGALRVGVGSSGLDASDSDEDEEASGHQVHSHAECGGGLGVGTRASNGCRELANKVEDMRRVVSAATQDVVEIMEDVQCEISG